MSKQRILTLYPFLYPGTTCWVFDDARTGLKEEAFVEGTSEMISRVVEQKKIPRAAQGFLLTFSDQPFAGHDVERAWVRSDAGGGDWYEGEVFGEPMDNWLCPALLLYFEKPPKRLYVRCDPLPAGVNPIWEPPSRLWINSLRHVRDDVPDAQRPRKPEVFIRGKTFGELFPRAAKRGHGRRFIEVPR